MLSYNGRLKQYYEGEMEAVRQKRREIADRLKVTNPLDREAQARHYSAWYYAAIHVQLSIPGMNQKGSFLASNGLAKTKGDKYEIGPPGFT